ncbi:hypothetical protein [Kineosporia babensis]|uniref:Uncharacterized protein n=1 Tax=Kineosporia babensis TaxID=499548 RepID=A0A9X1SR90_9ACTN|nr:hypothetical protein [Kineosporia babensis]MCD5309354.1 hypothetical protein [Kineosporia babensis]
MSLRWTRAEQQVRSLDRLVDAFGLDETHDWLITITAEQVACTLEGEPRLALDADLAIEGARIQYETWPNRSVGAWRIEMKPGGTNFYPATAGL